MGSPLGPTFTDFYMSSLENHVLSQDKISNPIFYVLYGDDIQQFLDLIITCSILNAD